eukprot:Phypoly_transcript_13694.p1 GENE.Phypoly_transcript_13694~~Phypoly_transcript_13694.p1  ORF type:complete len:258 (+),score=78.43 Phypoly_transcript_13694:254-1027(+)
MNYQICSRLRSLSLLAKPPLCAYQASRLFHATAPRFASPSPSSTSSSPSSTSSSTPSSTSPPTTPSSTTTSTDLFRQTLKDVKEKEQPKAKKGKKEEPGVRRATCTMRNGKGSPYKMALILNQIRGLSYQEAVAQMQFSKKHMAVYVKRALNSARYNAENIHNMNPDRLLVENCWVCKGRYLKRLKIHARGKHGMMVHPYFHITVVLREVPPTAGERRLGRFGRTNKALRRQLGLEEEGAESKTVDVTSKISATKSA